MDWFGASPQVPYSVSHQYPTLLVNPEQLASLVPENAQFDLWMGSITYTSVISSPVHQR